MLCLGKGFDDQHPHWVATHQFPMGLMECNVNKSIVVTKDDDVIIELPLLPVDNDKVKKISTLLKR